MFGLCNRMRVFNISECIGKNINIVKNKNYFHTVIIRKIVLGIIFVYLDFNILRDMHTYVYIHLKVQIILIYLLF